MPSIDVILSTLKHIAPSRFAFSFDKVGLQIGSKTANVTKAIVSLDRSQAAAEFAVERGAQLLLSHHPLIWEPLTAVTDETYQSRVAHLLIKSGLSFIAAHTNWDCAQGGINDTLAQRLQLQHVRSIGSAALVKRLKLVMFAPQDAVQPLIDAASEAGAGVIGLYKRCAFVGQGTGTFYAAPGTDPTIGTVGKVEEVRETRIEMVLPEERCAAVTDAVIRVHPYEEAAYDFVRLTDSDEQPITRLGSLSSPMALSEFAGYIDKALGTRSWTFGDPARTITRVAVCGGAADDEWQAAQAAGADVLVTGEVKQHVGLEVSENGFAIVAAGHYATEHPGCVALRGRMATAMPEVEWLVFEPKAGQAGRPF